MPFLAIFAQKWPFLTFLRQANTTFCPFYYQISSKDDILPLHPSKNVIFCPKNVIFGVFCPKMTIFDIFWASKDDILPLLPSDIKQRRHFAHSSIKNDIFCPNNVIFGVFLPKNGHF